MFKEDKTMRAIENLCRIIGAVVSFAFAGLLIVGTFVMNIVGMLICCIDR